MSPDLVPRRVADDVFEIVVASPATAQQLAQALRQEGFAEDVVAGLASVSIRFDPMTIDTLTFGVQRDEVHHTKPCMGTNLFEVWTRLTAIFDCDLVDLGGLLFPFKWHLDAL